MYRSGALPEPSLDFHLGYGAESLLEATGGTASTSSGSPRCPGSPMPDPAARERATKQLAQMWPRLVAFFSARGGGFESEDLASETIARVLAHLARHPLPTDTAAFTYGVARNVRSEHLRQRVRFAQHAVEVTEDLPAHLPPVEGDDVADPCVIECLRALPPRRLAEFVEYHAGPGPNIQRRAEMAGRLRITPNALQQRVSATRQQLKRDIERCRARRGQEGSTSE